LLLVGSATGAVDCIATGNCLRERGLQQTGKRTYELADGKETYSTSASRRWSSRATLPV